MSQEQKEKNLTDNSSSLQKKEQGQIQNTLQDKQGGMQLKHEKGHNQLLTQVKKQEEDNFPKDKIKQELISMQFDINDIEEALKFCDDLDKAIQFIINKLEFNEKQQSNMTKQVKLFLIARMDLKMGPGKIAAQVGHAVLKAFQMMRNSTLYSQQSAKLLVQWLENGQKSKILKVQTQNQLFELIEKAKKKSINCCYIRDAGRTQIAAGSTTVAAIGPIQQNIADFLSFLKELN